MMVTARMVVSGRRVHRRLPAMGLSACGAPCVTMQIIEGSIALRDVVSISGRQGNGYARRNRATHREDHQKDQQFLHRRLRMLSLLQIWHDVARRDVSGVTL